MWSLSKFTTPNSKSWIPISIKLNVYVPNIFKPSPRKYHMYIPTTEVQSVFLNVCPYYSTSGVEHHYLHITTLWLKCHFGSIKLGIKTPLLSQRLILITCFPQWNLQITELLILFILWISKSCGGNFPRHNIKKLVIYIF